MAQNWLLNIELYLEINFVLFIFDAWYIKSKVEVSTIEWMLASPVAKDQRLRIFRTKHKTQLTPDLTFQVFN